MNLPKGSTSQVAEGEAQVWARVEGLRRERPRSWLVRWTVGVFCCLTLLSVGSGVVSFDAIFEARRRANIERFVTQDLVPFPLREAGFSWPRLWSWCSSLWSERGQEAMFATLMIAVLAIVLAGLGGAVMAPLGARTMMRSEPFGATRGRRGGLRGLTLAAVVVATRFFCVLLRAIPEYVWAFLLLAVLGPSAWPVVIALALHNAGILGRLGADTLENLDAKPLRALHGLGATRSQVLVGAAVPAALPRYLLYFFYRYETCIREATVLGMLGVVSLGYWIQDARARLHYDDMLFLVLLGSLLVIVGDVLSMAARAWLRRSG